MLILIDERAPEMARRNLEEFGKVVGFSTNGLVYDAISGHPDIFITQFADFIVSAPNLPEAYKTLFKKHNSSSLEGKLPVRVKYPETARYNAVITQNYFYS